MKKSVNNTALADISKYTKEIDQQNPGEFSSVSANQLNTKKTRYLNRLLGLHLLNKKR